MNHLSKRYAGIISIIMLCFALLVQPVAAAEDKAWVGWGLQKVSLGSPPIYSFKAKSDVWVRNGERPLLVDVYLHDMKYQGPKHNGTRVRVFASIKHKITGKVTKLQSDETFGVIKKFSTRLEFPAIRSGDYDVDINHISIQYLNDGDTVWSFAIQGADSRHGTSWVDGSFSEATSKMLAATESVKTKKKAGQYVFGLIDDKTEYVEVPVLDNGRGYTVALPGSLLIIPKVIDRQRYVFPHLLGDTHEGSAARCERNVYATVDREHQDAEIYTPYEAWKELDGPLVAMSANFFDVRRQEAHTNWKMNRCSSPMGMYFDNVTKGPTRGTHNAPNEFLAGLPYFINPNNNKNIQLDTMIWIDDVDAYRMLVHADSVDAKNVERQLDELVKDKYKFIAISGVGLHDRMNDPSITPAYSETGMGRVAMSVDELENLIFIYQGGDVNDGLDRTELYGFFRMLRVDNAIEFSGGPYAAIAIKDDSFDIYGGKRTNSSCNDSEVWCSPPTNARKTPGASPAWLGISNR